MSEEKALVFGCRPPAGIPGFLRMLVTSLKQNGIALPLIFQNVTRRGDLEKLRSRVERGGPLPLEKLDTNLIADLLKLYLLELPEPLVPYDNYDHLLGNRSDEIGLRELKKQVATFPESNLLCLGYVISLLSEIARNFAVTKMSTNALAVVFAPLLLRAQDESMTGMISDALPTQRVVRAFVENFEVLFKTALIDAGVVAKPAPPVVPVVPPPQSSDIDPKPTSVLLRSALRALEPPPIVPKPVLPKKAISFAEHTKKAVEEKKPPPLSDKPEHVKERALHQQEAGFALGKTLSETKREEARHDDPPLPSRAEVPKREDPPRREEERKEDIQRELTDVQHKLAPKAARESHQPPLNMAVNLDQLVNTLIHTKEDAVPLSSRMSFKPLDPKNSNVIISQGWKFEQGNANVTIEQQLPFVIIDQEKNFPHYEAFFYAKDHVNYLAPETDIGPIVISVEKKADEAASFSTKALLRSVDAYEMLALPQKIKKAGDLNKALKSNYPQLADVHFKELRERTGDGELAKNLLNYERANIFNNCKFGVLYRRAGQQNEDEMFANNQTSPAFEEFMQLIGSRITLHGWPGFRGGLDTQRGTTGTHSYYTKFGGFEIMYHVAPLLPFYPNDKQQLERKRHLGNDIVVIVFQDSDEPFAPAWIKSEFIHIYGVVSPADDGRRYRFSVAAKDDVPACGPFLPSPALFEKDDNFKNFLLTKLINLERVAMYAPVFATKMTRTRRRLLDACNKEFKDKGEKAPGTFRLTPSTTKTKLKDIFSTVRGAKKDEPAPGAVPGKGPAISGPLNMNEVREVSPSHARPQDDTISRALSPDPARKRGKLLPEWTLPQDAAAARRDENTTRQRTGSAIALHEGTSAGINTGDGDAKKTSSPTAARVANERADSPTPSPPMSKSAGAAASATSPAEVRNNASPTAAEATKTPEPVDSSAVEEEPPQMRLSPKERVLLAQLEADAKAVAGDVRSLLNQVRTAFNAKPTQEEVAPLQSFIRTACSALEAQMQDAQPSMLVKRPPAADMKHPLDAVGVEALNPRFLMLLDLLKQQERDSEIAPTPDEALRRARPMVTVLKICRAYLDKQVMTLEEEQQKLRELRTSIVTAARDVQYRLVFVQSQIRNGALPNDRALPLLKEICKRLGLESSCGTADAVTRLQRLVKELSAERVALDQRLLLARFVEIGQLVRAAKKELMTNYDVQPLPITQLTLVDPGYALSACTSELERLYTNLAEEVRTLEEAVAYARLVRAIKKFIKGQDLLPAVITKPTPTEKPMSEIERMKLNSLKEVSAYGIMEIKSKLQLDSLNSMKDTDDDEPGVRFDLLSQCLQLETVKDFVASFRPATATAPTLAEPKGSSGKSLTEVLTRIPSGNAAAPPGSAPASSQQPSPPTTTAAAPAPAPTAVDGQEWAKLQTLKKAMSETAEDMLGALVNLQKQMNACNDVGQAHAIARLAVVLKSVCSSTIDVTQVEFIKRVESSPNPPTPVELATIANLRNVAEVVVDETRGWIAAQKRALQAAETLPQAVKVGKGINLLRKLLEAYLRS